MISTEKLKLRRTSAAERTRQSILDAAAYCLARSPGATMAEVADVAGMARSTVHRHYPERTNLLHALKLKADEQIREAYLRSEIAGGTPLDRILRLARSLFDQADLFMAAYFSSSQVAKLTTRYVVDPNMKALVEQGQKSGSINATLHPSWIQQAFWGLLYASWVTFANGDIDRFDALGALLDALKNMLSPSITPCANG